MVMNILIARDIKASMLSLNCTNKYSLIDSFEPEIQKYAERERLLSDRL
nr:unnamed protein product [Callosobruchus chinensis]